MKDSEKNKILEEARKRAVYATEKWSHNFDEMEADDAFIHGDQWPDAVAKDREAKGRPILTINKAPYFVDQVTGEQRQMRPAIDVFPAEGDYQDERVQNLAGAKDYSKSEIFQGLIRNIEYVSAADTAYDTAFDHAASHGLGWFRLVTEYCDDDTFNQQIKIKRVRNWRSVLVDPDFEEPDGSDMQWGMIFYNVPKDEFERRWPKKEMVSAEDYSGSDLDVWTDDAGVRIAEYYRMVPTTKTLYLLSDQRVVGNEDFPKIQDELEAAGITVVRERTVKTHKCEWLKISGADVLEGPTEVVFGGVPLIPVLGKELVIKGKVYYRGVIRNAKDSMRMYNYWRSAATESIALQPKAPFVISDKQMQGYQHIWDKANTENLPYLPYKSGTGEVPPQRQSPPVMSQGIINEVMNAEADIRATVGMNEADTGQQGNETSGRAIMARRQQGDARNFAFADNLMRSMRHAGKLLVKAIPQIYDTEQVIRVRFKDDSEDVVLINQTIIDEQTGEEVTIHDLSAGKYDVLVKTGPSYSTQRQEAVDAMIEMIRAVPGWAQMLGDLIAKNLDFPGADEFAERLQKMMPPEFKDEEDQEPPQPTPEQQVGMATAQADMATAQAKQADAEAKAMKAQADQARAMQEIEMLPVREQEQQVDLARAQAQFAEAIERMESLQENIKDEVAGVLAQTMLESIQQSDIQPGMSTNPENMP